MTSKDLGTLFKKHPLGVVCGALSLIFVAALFFRGELKATAEATLEQKTAESEKISLNIQYAAQLKEQLEALVAANKKIAARIVRAGQLGTNTQYFYNLETDTGVKLIDLRQTTAATAAASKTAFIPVAFSVSVQGNLEQILKFLRELENGVHYCRVMNATCSGNTANRDAPITLALNLELLGTP